MSHYVEVCQFGTRHGTCRCMSRDKTVRTIECPTPATCAALPTAIKVAKTITKPTPVQKVRS